MQRQHMILTSLFCAGLLTSCTSSGVATKAEEASRLADSSPNKVSVVAKTVPTSRPVTLPVGTVIRVRTLSTVSTRDSKSGETIQATLAEPLVVEGAVVAPLGAEASLIVVDSDPGGRVKGRAQLGLRLATLRVAGQSRTVTAGTFWQEAAGTKKKDAAKVGILTGIGAAIGAVADGGKGAAIGAGAGAGAGTAVVLSTRGDPAVVAAESLLTFRLTQAMTVDVKN